MGRWQAAEGCHREGGGCGVGVVACNFYTVGPQSYKSGAAQFSKPHFTCEHFQ